MQLVLKADDLPLSRLGKVWIVSDSALTQFLSLASLQTRQTKQAATILSLPSRRSIRVTDTGSYLSLAAFPTIVIPITENNVNQSPDPRIKRILNNLVYTMPQFSNFTPPDTPRLTNKLRYFRSLHDQNSTLSSGSSRTRVSSSNGPIESTDTSLKPTAPNNSTSPCPTLHKPFPTLDDGLISPSERPFLQRQYSEQASTAKTQPPLLDPPLGSRLFADFDGELSKFSSDISDSLRDDSKPTRLENSLTPHEANQERQRKTGTPQPFKKKVPKSSRSIYKAGRHVSDSGISSRKSISKPLPFRRSITPGPRRGLTSKDSHSHLSGAGQTPEFPIDVDKSPTLESMDAYKSTRVAEARGAPEARETPEAHAISTLSRGMQLFKTAETSEVLQKYESKESEASEFRGPHNTSDEADVRNACEASRALDPSEISETARALENSQISHSESLPNPFTPGTSSQDQIDASAQEVSSLSDTRERHTAEVKKSWLLNDLSDYAFKTISAIMSSKPSGSDAYIYVYCHAQGNGSVYSGREEDLPESGKLPANGTLPIFRLADGKYLSLKEALLHNAGRKNGNKRARPDSIGEQPRMLRIKIGQAMDVEKRLDQWKMNCKEDLMLLLVYGYDSDIGPRFDPAPLRHPRSPPFSDAHNADNSPARHANACLSEVSWESIKESRGVPYGSMVERLIINTLDEDRKEWSCSCGTRHKEWFDIPATVEGIQGVDDVIQRWISWSKDREEYAIDEGIQPQQRRSPRRYKRNKQRNER